MAKNEVKEESLQGGFQPKHNDFGFQPQNANVFEIIKGFQPVSSVAQPEGNNPPSSGSNVRPPETTRSTDSE